MPSSQYKQDHAVYRLKEVNGQWHEVAHLGEEKIFPKHHEFTDGSTSVFYLLTKGRVQLSGIAEDGSERGIIIMEEGVILGEVVGIHKSIDHTTSLRALTECAAIAFPTSLLEDTGFCRQYPHLMINVVKSLGIKVGAFFSQIYDSDLMDAKAKICRMLAHIWRDQGEVTPINPDLSQTDMANLLGIHRSSVCRVIRQLRDDKIIGAFSKTHLDILNAETLMENGHMICLLPPTGTKP